MLSRVWRPLRLDRAAGNLSLDDKATQISFRRIGVERDLGPLENTQQFGLAALQASQEFVEVAIAGMDGKYSIEPDLKSAGCTWVWMSLIVFKKLVKEPDQLAEGLDMLYLVRLPASACAASVRHAPGIRRIGGSISAGAEEPTDACSRYSSNKVYLRGCGGTCAQHEREGAHRGLSPRVRRNRMLEHVALGVDGSISAGAEEPLRLASSSAKARVYLRGCGGT